MKANGLITNLLALLFLFTTLSAAWPWPIGEKLDAVPVARRQENKPASTSDTSSTQDSSSATSTQATRTTDESSVSESASGSGSDSASGSGSDSASASASGSGSKSASGSGSKTTSRSSKTTPIDPRLPPGGVQMVSPAVIQGSQYYKVGDYVTFQWNYTSLSVTPSAIDILASCSLNSATYTIAANMSVEETGSIVWDTGNTATLTNPYPVATYTLIIQDAAKDFTDAPSAGYLAAYDQYSFGMYTGQPYVPLNEFRCATCSGALSIHERQAIGVLAVTSLVTILSFTWFANGFGLFN